MDEDELLTGKECARALRMNADVLRKWRKRGLGPAFVPIGRRVFYRRGAIGKYLQDLERPAAAGKVVIEAAAEATA